MTVVAETLGARLRAARGDLSQDDFAGRLGVNKETIGKYERGERYPAGDILARMRSKLGIDINWLLTGEGAMRLNQNGAEPAGQPAATAMSAAGRVEPDADLYGRIVEGISAVYKECGVTVTLRQVGALAAGTYADLVNAYADPDERRLGLKLALEHLRRQLREAISNPTGDVASKHRA